MPYGKTYRRKPSRTYKPRTSFKQSRVSTSSGYNRRGSVAAKQGGKGPSTLLSHVNLKGPEKKAVSVSQGAVTGFVDLNFSPFFLLAPIVQGVNSNNRIGNRVRVTDLDLRYVFYGGQLVSGSQPNSQVRIIIVYDKMCRQSTPAPTDLLIGNPVTFLDVYRNIMQNDRFIVIADHVSKLAAESDVADAMVPVAGRITKVMDLETDYVGVGASATDINSGGIFLMAAVNGNTSTGTQLGLSALLQYIDL